MKIVCDSCGAKYSIADEKVAGKIFKIRCKKCSSVLEVRGDQTGAHAVDSVGEAADASSDDGWYIVVDGAQQGPLSAPELGKLFAGGSVGLDSYVWKEGFDDWKVANEVPELLNALETAGQGEPSGTAKIATESSAIGSGGDLFSEGHGREPTSEIDPEAEGLDHSPTGPENPVQSPFAAEPAEAAESAAGDASGAAMGAGAMSAASSPMTGQRNENSVLFSLSNLQQLASRGGSPAEAAAPAATASPATSSRASATGEGSGLIDIRALAKATTPGDRAAPAQAVDDLLAIGTGPAGGTLAGPLLGPAPSETSDSNRWIWIAGAAAALLAIVGAGIGVGMALGGSPEDGLEVAQAPTEARPLVEARALPTQAPVAAAVGNEAEQAADPEPAGIEPLPVEPEIEEATPEQEADARAASGTKKQRSSASKRRRTRSSAGESSKPETATAPAPAKKRSGGNLDSLMDEVVGGAPAASSKGSTQSAKSGSSSSLPDSPSRGDVKTALQGVSGAVKSCNQGEGGTAIVEVVFSGSTGRVGKANIVSGPFKGTPVGSCIESAVKRARVPRFKQSTFEVKFPYRL